MTANILWLSAMSVRPPRVRTHSFSPFVCHIYFLGFRVVIGLRLVAQPHPSQPASCDFCSSDQRFACTFLQIPPHDGHPWCSAMTFPLLGQSRDFHPLECAHAGRTQKTRSLFASRLQSFIFQPANTCSFLSKARSLSQNAPVTCASKLTGCSSAAAMNACSPKAFAISAAFAAMPSSRR